MTKFILVTECAIEHKNKFLIIKRPSGVHASGLLSFPGGKFEIFDATHEDSDVIKEAIKREVLEEVGLELVDSIHYITSSYFIDDKTQEHIIDIIYYCKLKETTVNIQASKREVPEYYWLTYEEIISKYNCPVWLKNYMRKVMNYGSILRD